MLNFAPVVFMLQLLVLGGDVEEESIHLPPRWTVGDTYVVRMHKHDRKETDGRTVTSVRTVTDIQVEVLSESDSGYELRWTFGPTKFLKGLQGIMALLAPVVTPILEDLQNGMEVRFATGEYGDYAKLINGEELSEFYQAAIDRIAQRLREARLPEEVIEALTAFADPMTDPDFQEFAMLTDIMPFYDFGGLILVPGEPFEYESWLIDLTTFEELPAQASYLLESWDDASQQAQLVSEAHLDAETASDAIAAVLKAMEISSEPSPDEIAAYSNDVRSTALFDRKLGLPLEVRHVRSVTVDGTKTTKTTVYELVLDLPPER